MERKRERERDRWGGRLGVDSEWWSPPTHREKKTSRSYRRSIALRDDAAVRHRQIRTVGVRV